MAHIIGHGRYAHETYPERSGLGAQGPQGTQGNQGAQGPQGTQGSQASVTEANVRAALALSTGPVTINNQNLTNVKIGSLNGVVNDGSSGATKNINWSAGAAHRLTLQRTARSHSQYRPDRARYQSNSFKMSLADGSSPGQQCTGRTAHRQL